MSPSVLIVDDEDEIAETLRELLTAEGFEVTIANNGLDGLERVRETRPDVVLLDIMMPVMDGRAMCRALRADPATADLPIVVMTAGGSMGRDTCDYTALLRKPFDVDVLIDLLRRCARHRPEADPSA